MSNVVQNPFYFQVTLAAAGTGQQISETDLIVKSFTVTAAASNAGLIYVADSNANAKANKGETIDALEQVVIRGDLFPMGNNVVNIKDFWFDGSTNGDKIIVSYML